MPRSDSRTAVPLYSITSGGSRSPAGESFYWQITTACWAKEPENRPDFSDIFEKQSDSNQAYAFPGTNTAEIRAVNLPLFHDRGRDQGTAMSRLVSCLSRRSLRYRFKQRLPIHFISSRPARHSSIQTKGGHPLSVSGPCQDPSVTRPSLEPHQ
jgi:hypothetical protein